ncbi:MAG: helix-turn-helix domain-containing protein [Oscillospiraceae bacterium]|nr:helix-turn-helix domain-containing protein [Oscillospiraceae bacterium]
MTENEKLIAALHAERTRARKSQNDAARYLGVTPQAISNWERGRNCIDCISLFRLLDLYGTDILSFLRSCGLLGEQESSRKDSEARLLALYQALDEKDQTRLLRIAEAFSEEEAPAKRSSRIIPLYRFLAAAGIPSPQPGEDYDELSVPADDPADFAVRIAGDSMEPHIHDGDIVRCIRSIDLRDGDVGIFYADNGMVCKQFVRDSEGNVYLLSLNRERADADLSFPASSAQSFCCYGKVLLKQRIPLP